MTFGVGLDREDDRRWLAEVPELSGVMCYGTTRDDAVARVQAFALRVIADRLEHGKTEPALLELSFKAASRRPEAEGLPVRSRPLRSGRPSAR